MELSIWNLDDIVVVDVSGVVDSRAAGRLYDALVERIGAGWKKLVVDVSDVGSLTRAGARGLIVASKLLNTAGGGMRICGADKSVCALLQATGFRHLLKLDPDHGASMRALSLAETQAP
jgi:anti-anti-sigma factor